MQTLNKISLFGILLILSNLSLSQRDTLFWFAAPDISSAVGDSPNYIVITSQSSTDVTIEIPANGAFTPINLSLAANSYQEINLSAFLSDIESLGPDLVSQNGLKITSDSAINVVYEVRSSNNKETFALKGTAGIGTDFYAPFQSHLDNDNVVPATNSGFEIVATEDNTTVLVTPRTNVTGHLANMSYPVTLQEGEVYSVSDADLLGSTSLSGSLISSNNPISVTVYEGALLSGSCNNIAGDQLTTSEYLGTNHIIQKGNSDEEFVYIMATENGTNISISNSGTSTTLLNWGESYLLSLSDDVNYIQSDKPIYVIQYTGNGCSLGMSQVPHVYCAGTYEASFYRATADSIGLFLHIRNGFENDFTLNGLTGIINPSDFQVVPGTNGEYVAGLIYVNVPVGSFNLVENQNDIFGLAVVNGAYNSGSSFSFISEYSSSPFVFAGIEDTVCANSNFPLSGLIGGGSVTGYWGSTGLGSFQGAIDDLHNVYEPSSFDTIISPINLILTSSGPCPVRKDTIVLHVTPEPIVNANIDQIVCANNALIQLEGSITGGSSQGEWSTNGSGTFSPSINDLNAVYTPTNADINLGTIEFILSSMNSGSCLESTDTMYVTISNAPIVDITIDTIAVCENAPNAIVSGTVSGASSTGKWITAGSGFFTPSNLIPSPTYEPSVNDISSGGVWLYLESTNNGDCNIAIDSVFVEFTTSASVNAGSNLSACTNDPEVNLNGIISGVTSTGEWTGGLGSYGTNNTDLGSTYTPTLAEINSGSLVLTLTSTNNNTCIAVSDNVVIDFIAPPTANFSFQDVCLGETVYFEDFSLSGFGLLTDWQWDFDNTSTSSDQDNYITYSTPGQYDVELVATSSVGCSDTVVQTVEVFELPNADFNYSINCNIDQIIIDFTDNSSVNNDVINSWFYDFGGQGAQSTQNPSQLFIGSGTFVVTEIVTTANGCIDSLVQTINIDDYPTAGFSYNTDNGLNTGATFEFIDTSSNATYISWEYGDGNSYVGEDASNIYFENGIYEVSQYVENNLGCSDSATILISINTVTDEIIELIPNAISPNGDGRNDVWKLDFIPLSYPNAIVEVYNRWGQQLFYSQGYEYPWNGKFEGERVADGTYFYVVDLKDGSEPIKGTILVLKNRE